MSTRLPRLAAYGVLAALLALFVGLFVESRRSAAVPSVDPKSDLIVSNRDRLRVCADIRVADQGQVTDRLTAGLGQVRRHPHWELTDFGDRTPALEGGCQAELPQDGVAKGVVVGPGVTARPGPYRTVVVVLGGEEADRLLGGQRAALAPYELMELKPGTTATVTQAVVVRDTFVGSPEFVKDYLTPAIGLHPEPGPNHEEDHHHETSS
ncbi:hypothetical protein RM555_25710 [Micromonospora sp. DSM 115977]|uniref:Uncharacterized protein n=1 Tax=Micromonospora reichwaldensis TaxID=3075516 RepID=A0ABU2X3G9_9ACTN|nr:hypothetical protein [Micromonospora sp. DSM 115977]MDT0532404.1 hypothetical protein [Micromonospora sp. DSM 115977]